MARATLVLREKVTDESGNILELALWRVPVSDRYREGVRYRLAYIEHRENVPSVLYDNHAPKDTTAMWGVPRNLIIFLASISS